MNGHLIRAWLVAGVVVLWAPIASKAINSVTAAADAIPPEATAVQTAPLARYSPGIVDIAKLVDAKVDVEVIKTYIKNSPTAYNPTATEIIALKNHGVGPEILTVMLQHGAEVRTQSMRAAQAAPNSLAPQAYAGAPNPYAPAPGYDSSAQAVYPNNAYNYPVSSYAYSPYAYACPGYDYGWCNYGYCWPYFWPSFYFGFGCYLYGGYCGYRYPYYYGGHGYYGGAGYHSQGGRPATFASHGGGFGGHASGRGH